MIKIGIGLSVLTNAILIGYVIGYTELFLFLSILIICGLVWYIGKTLNHYSEIDKDFSSMLQDMTEFENHIKQLYEMEMFYGDETLKGMIVHLGELIDELGFYREKYFFEEEGDDDQAEEKTSQEEQE
tara:strand:- start:341 stop:724 length:384 start_codon:yes stop_codon:yes gene_type:complete